MNNLKCFSCDNFNGGSLDSIDDYPTCSKSMWTYYGNTGEEILKSVEYCRRFKRHKKKNLFKKIFWSWME